VKEKHSGRVIDSGSEFREVNVDQMPFGGVSFAENPDPRCPCVLLLDTSRSMEGAPIAALNAGIKTYKDELAADSLAAKRVEVALVTFGGEITLVSDFGAAGEFRPPLLQPTGDTPMGGAIAKALEMLQARKQLYKQNGVQFYRPWLFLITDGAPTDEWAAVAEKVKEGEAARAFAFFAVGVSGADFDILKQISVREPLKLDGLRFHDLFVWLSNSQRAVSHSKAGEETPLENPTKPDGWAKV
jgi:uncharacterized protein YegL